MRTKEGSGTPETLILILRTQRCGSAALLEPIQEDVELDESVVIP